MLHVSPLRTTEDHDPVLRMDVQAQGIDALPVDHDEVLFLGAVDSLITYKVFQLHHLLAFGVGKLSFRLQPGILADR